MKTPQQFLLETLAEGQSGTLKGHPESTFFFTKEGTFLLDIDKKNKVFCVSWHEIWQKMKSDFGLESKEIKELCNALLEEAFRLEGFATPVKNGIKPIY